MVANLHGHFCKAVVQDGLTLPSALKFDGLEKLPEHRLFMENSPYSASFLFLF